MSSYPRGTIVPGTCTGPSGTWEQLRDDVIRHDGVVTDAMLLDKLDAFLAAHPHVERTTGNVLQFVLA